MFNCFLLNVSVVAVPIAPCFPVRPLGPRPRHVHLVGALFANTNIGRAGDRNHIYMQRTSNGLEHLGPLPSSGVAFWTFWRTPLAINRPMRGQDLILLWHELRRRESPATYREWKGGVHARRFRKRPFTISGEPETDWSPQSGAPACGGESGSGSFVLVEKRNYGGQVAGKQVLRHDSRTSQTHSRRGAGFEGCSKLPSKSSLGVGSLENPPPQVGHGFLNLCFGA